MEHLINLEWLDLSSNKLTGEIPRQLVDLAELEVLNLLRNRLVGPIPWGNWFNTFSSDSYSEYVGFCGFPLIKTCGDDKGQQSLASSTILEDDLKLRVHWKKLYSWVMDVDYYLDWVWDILCSKLRNQNG